MPPIHVVLAVDRNCVIGCAVSMRSILDNCGTGRSVRFHVATHGISERDRRALVETVDRADRGAAVDFGTFDPRRVRHLTASKLINHMAYATLFLSELAPEDASRCLWVDCDLVFRRDVGELWESDLEGRTLGAVADGSPPLMAKYQRRLGMTQPLYFNSGVLLVDLDRWREHGVGSRALANAERLGARLILHDQDALNVTLEGDWVSLDPDWNAWVIRPDLTEEASAVFHYMGAPKPWHADYEGPFLPLFHRYLDRTAFAGWRPWNPAGIGATMRRVRRRLPSRPGMLRALRSIRTGQWTEVSG